MTRSSNRWAVATSFSSGRWGSRSAADAAPDGRAGPQTATAASRSGDRTGPGPPRQHGSCVAGSPDNSASSWRWSHGRPAPPRQDRECPAMPYSFQAVVNMMDSLAHRAGIHAGRDAAHAIGTAQCLTQPGLPGFRQSGHLQCVQTPETGPERRQRRFHHHGCGNARLPPSVRDRGDYLGRKAEHLFRISKQALKKGLIPFSAGAGSIPARILLRSASASPDSCLRPAGYAAARPLEHRLGGVCRRDSEPDTRICAVRRQRNGKSPFRTCLNDPKECHEETTGRKPTAQSVTGNCVRQR